MKITIVRADGLAGIDGVFWPVDTTDMEPDVSVVEFDTGAGAGFVQYMPAAGRADESIGATAFAPYQTYVNRWKVVSAPPVRTLEEVREDVRSQINSTRDTLEAGGFTYMGKTFDSDPRSVQRISVAVQAAQGALAAGQPFLVNWTASDNTQVALDAVAMLGMPAALAQAALALHMHARDKKAEVDACTTINQLEEITW